ncbi:MAG: glycosyltransferase family 4 protein [Alphaproteobacteria bacterium]|nr:glycosyltransferase family 4 protein [Alphaproteobacteria bacterium]
MHIAMVAARYFPMIGGIETHIYEVGRRMVANGHRVTILTTDPSGALPQEEYSEGMLVKRVLAWPKGRDYYLAPRIYREISRTDADIIHFQGYNTLVAPIGLVAAAQRRIPFVLTFHSGGHSSPLRNAIRGLQQRALAPLVGRAEHLIGVSQFEVDLFSQRMRVGRDRFTVVPNGAALPAVSGAPPIRDPNLILSIGRLERYKGHQRVLEAFPDLLRQLPDARLMIIGSGPYEAALRKMTGKLHLEDRVTITSIPSSERERLTDVLMRAGLVVLLSDYEAHPVAIMEALSLRRRVLVTDTSGLRELADKGLCHRIPMAATPRAIANAIAAELANDDDIPQLELPDWDGCARQLVGVYEQVLSRAGTPGAQRRAIAMPSIEARPVG